MALPLLSCHAAGRRAILRSATRVSTMSVFAEIHALAQVKTTYETRPGTKRA